MFAQVEGKEVKLSGILNESANLSEINAALDNALENVEPNERVAIDFSEVKYGSSLGLQVWIKAINRRRRRLKYVKVPVWLVEQFSWLEDLVDEGILVESVYACFYCASKDVNEMRLLRLGVDLPYLDDYTGYDFTYVKNGDTFEPDFLPATYFLFARGHLAHSANQTDSG